MNFNFNIEEIKYAKILYKGFDDCTNTSKVIIKNITNREIIACTKFISDLQIKTPQVVSLNIVYKDGLYKTKTTLKKIYKEQPYTFFILETPQNVEYEQNREFFRVSINLDCIYRIKEENKEYKAKTVDISANGMSVIMPELIIFDKHSELILTFKDKTLVLQTQYIRNEKLENAYKISFSFKNLSEHDRDYISQLCIQKQLEDKRNSLK